MIFSTNELAIATIKADKNRVPLSGSNFGNQIEISIVKETNQPETKLTIRTNLKGRGSPFTKSHEVWAALEAKKTRDAITFQRKTDSDSVHNKRVKSTNPENAEACPRRAMKRGFAFAARVQALVI